ncbi:ABC transporter ATP-binding protein, partial [Candidatus Uhrbacteria bacterium]
MSLRHLFRYPRFASLMILVIISAQLTVMMTPYALQRLVDAFGEVSPTTYSLFRFTYLYVLPIAGIRVASLLLWRTGGFLASEVHPKVMRDIMERGFSAILSQSYRFFSDNFAGALVRRAQALAGSYRSFINVFWWDLLPLSVTILGSMLLLGLYSPFFALIIGVWVLCLAAVQLSVSRIKLPYDAERASKHAAVIGLLADDITNATNVMLFNGFRPEQRRMHRRLEEWRFFNIKQWRIGETGAVIQNVLNFFCEIAMMGLVVWFWMRGQMSFGTVILVQSMLWIMFDRTYKMGQIMRDLYEAGADALEMLDILDLVPEVQDRRGAKSLVVTRGSIEFIDVSFRYRDEREVLSGFGLTIPPTQKVALVGPSGSGKTTVTKLLFRFFDVQAGTITIDGQDISNVTQESLRKAIAYVPQEPILFHRSLLENIRYGRPGASEKEVIEAAKKAHCHEFIRAFPEGYETLVGERGVKLSGGERQRVAIARAILKNAPILVLDEATSSLDSESESLIQDALKKLMRNKTVIVIAHRLSTIMEMDRIIVMENGRIVDEGTH